jgi:hypothetical protein
MGRRLDDPFFFCNFADWNYMPPFEKGFNDLKCIISYYSIYEIFNHCRAG